MPDTTPDRTRLARFLRYAEATANARRVYEVEDDPEYPGFYLVRDVPVFVAHTRGDATFTDADIAAIVRHHADLDRTGHRVPVFEGHHAFEGEEDRPKVANLRNFREGDVEIVDPDTHAVRTFRAAFADLGKLKPEYARRMLAGDLEYRSVEVYPGTPRISGLALTSTVPPYFKFANLDVVLAEGATPPAAGEAGREHFTPFTALAASRPDDRLVLCYAERMGFREKRMAKMRYAITNPKIGMRVEGGNNPSDYDTGEIVEPGRWDVVPEGAVFVAWDSGVATAAFPEDLRPEGQRPYADPRRPRRYQLAGYRITVVEMPGGRWEVRDLGGVIEAFEDRAEAEAFARRIMTPADTLDVRPMGTYREPARRYGDWESYENWWYVASLSTYALVQAESESDARSLAPAALAAVGAPAGSKPTVVRRAEDFEIGEWLRWRNQRSEGTYREPARRYQLASVPEHVRFRLAAGLKTGVLPAEPWPPTVISVMASTDSKRGEAEAATEWLRSTATAADALAYLGRQGYTHERTPRMGRRRYQESLDRDKTLAVLAELGLADAIAAADAVLKDGPATAEAIAAHTGLRVDVVNAAVARCCPPAAPAAPVVAAMRERRAKAARYVGPIAGMNDWYVVDAITGERPFVGMSDAEAKQKVAELISSGTKSVQVHPETHSIVVTFAEKRRTRRYAEVTDAQIRQFQAQAAIAGDLEAVAICNIALGLDPLYAGGGMVDLDPEELAMVTSKFPTVASARRACAEFIADLDSYADRRPRRRYTASEAYQAGRDFIDDETLNEHGSGILHSVSDSPDEAYDFALGALGREPTDEELGAFMAGMKAELRAKGYADRRPRRRYEEAAKSAEGEAKSEEPAKTELETKLEARIEVMEKTLAELKALAEGVSPEEPAEDEVAKEKDEAKAADQPPGKEEESPMAATERKLADLQKTVYADREERELARLAERLRRGSYAFSEADLPEIFAGVLLDEKARERRYKAYVRTLAQAPGWDGFDETNEPEGVLAVYAHNPAAAEKARELALAYQQDPWLQRQVPLETILKHKVPGGRWPAPANGNGKRK